METKTPTISLLEQLVKTGSENVHLGRFIAGVAYALEQYERLAAIVPKQDRSDEFYSDETLQLLSSIRRPVEPPANWLRGFFYNAAIMRLDAAWERSLRVILRDTTDANGPTLYAQLLPTEPTLPAYESSIFKQVRKEVNALKHKLEGASEDIREKPEVVQQGLEELLALLERRVISPLNDRL